MSKKQKKTDEVKIEIDERDIKIGDLTETLKRLQAEFENYKKRVEKEKQETCEYACRDFVLKILPVLDSFQLALKNNNTKGDFVKGVELIYSQLYNMLESLGLRKIKCEGKFDPNYHEVLLSVDAKEKSDTILEELQTGYMLKDKVIRHSKVKVSK